MDSLEYNGPRCNRNLVASALRHNSFKRAAPFRLVLNMTAHLWACRVNYVVSAATVVLIIVGFAYMSDDSRNEVLKLTRTECRRNGFASPYTGRNTAPLSRLSADGPVPCWVPSDGGLLPVVYQETLPANMDNPKVGWLLSYSYQDQFVAGIVMCTAMAMLLVITKALCSKGDRYDYQILVSYLCLVITFILVMAFVVYMTTSSMKNSKLGTCAWVQTKEVSLMLLNTSNAFESKLLNPSTGVRYTIKPPSIQLMQALQSKTKTLTATISDTGRQTPLYIPSVNIKIDCISDIAFSDWPSTNIGSGHFSPLMLGFVYLFCVIAAGITVLCICFCKPGDCNSADYSRRPVVPTPQAELV